MKKLIASLFLLLSMIQTSYGLSIEVAPLKLKANVEAFGIHLGVDGSKAIVFAGKRAQDLANVAGIAFNKTTQVLIVSGEGVSKLLGTAVKGTYKGGKFLAKNTYKAGKYAGKGTYRAGKYIGKTTYRTGKFAVKGTYKVAKTAIIMTGDVIDAAFDLTLDALRLGKNVIVVTYKKGKSFGSFIVKGLYKIGKAPIVLITNSGEEVVKFTGYVLGLPLKIICSTFKLVRLPVACTTL